jgi:hypothetical protein
MSANITTFIEEKEDIIFPLLNKTTTTSFYNDITISESTLFNSGKDYHHFDNNNEEKGKSIEISFDKTEFKPITISFDNINYIIGEKKVENKEYFKWKSKIFPFCKPIPMKQILTDVSGIFTPGMNAILGIFIIYSNFYLFVFYYY